MPKFKFEISRTYTITEGVERTFEADTAAEAQQMAEAMASDMNQDCPDDCSEIESGHTEIGNFEVRLVEDKLADDPKSRFNHACGLAFTVISNQEDGQDITAEMLKQALQKRIEDLDREGPDGWLEAAGNPFDTYKED